MAKSSLLRIPLRPSHPGDTHNVCDRMLDLRRILDVLAFAIEELQAHAGHSKIEPEQVSSVWLHALEARDTAADLVHALHEGAA